jgi:Family of unknown function (DUF5906)
MDFFQVCTKETRGGVVEVYPDFIVGRSKDLMVRGQSFYAIWDEARGLWSTDEYDVRRMVDTEVETVVERLKADGVPCSAKLLRSHSTNGWTQYKKFLKNASDDSHQLDEKLTFANTEVKKSDYVSRRLPYSLAPGPTPAWDEIMSTLYSEEERAKIEWAFGSIISGDSRKIQKFIVLYGPPGSGKGTVITIAQKLFDGYYTSFDAKALVGNNNSFGTEAFKNNPLLAIQHDGDLSRIEDNSKLNSIVSHEDMTLNEKYKPSYTSRINAFLIMGTNKPVKITDAKSGLLRRLIDVIPTGNRIDVNRYLTLMSQIDFELGAIAHHCLEVYRNMGKNYYNAYRPLNMMLQTDAFLNFVEAHFDIFKAQDGTTLKQAWELYKEYCIEAAIEYKLTQYRFRDELKNYFDEFHDRLSENGTTLRSVFRGFNAKPYKTPLAQDITTFSLVLDESTSLLDELYKDCPAQYGKNDETPEKYWTDEERLIRGELRKPRTDQIVSTTLKDLDTSRVHFVKVPLNHIVIDFDLKDANGKKSLEANLEAASLWPPTYAELSKSGGGVHLHYNYDGGDPLELAANYADGIEIKVFAGGSSLRRKLTRCNNIEVATINSGLPFKEKKPVLDVKTLQSEKGLRELITRNLRKEIHPGTKPSIDFIAKILDDAHKSGMAYDVTDMRPKIMAFANNSSNHALDCLKVVKNMKFKADEVAEEAAASVNPKDQRLVMFDVEVYPNLFVICWGYEDSDTVVKMINPSPADVEALMQLMLVGYNCRRYDNHILWGRMMGMNNQQLYELSQKIINGDQNAMFGEAYNISYADIYDFASTKQSLKKWMIQLKMHHMEMDLPWDQPVPPEMVSKVVEYCVNDVKGTKATFKHLKQDFVARQILAALSGLSVNDTTQKHTARIIFGTDRRPQEKFNYTDLSKEFPGYVYDFGKSTYRDEVVGEGGYVYAEPGMYSDVAVLDVASMHPTSIEVLDLFGPYTDAFSALKAARIAIKRHDYDHAREMLDGVLEPYLGSEDDAEALSYALKIVINIVYGLTSAKFDNPFRDVRNKDNIVAKRGALFMIDLKHAVQTQGFQVVHIKTDSIKIPNATPEIIQFVMDFGKKHGYDFEHEATYDKMCLVNDAVYIARVGWNAKGKPTYWYPVGAQFQHPVVFKALFSDEEITFDDMCETKQVTQGAMYLDFNESEATPNTPYKGMHFVGRIGMFVPVHKSAGGAKLLRVKDNKTYAVAGTKGFLWLEAEMVRSLCEEASDRLLFEDMTFALMGEGLITDIINVEYYEGLVGDALETIEKFGKYTDLLK